MVSIEKSEDIKVTTVKEFANLIGEFKEIWRVLVGKKVRRFTAMKFTSGNRYFLDKYGGTIGYAIEGIVDRISVVNKTYFITINYSTEYSCFDRVTGRSQALSLNEQFSMLLNREYDEPEFIQKFDSVHPPITIEEINLHGSSGFEGISRTNGNRKPVWAMITA